VQEHCALYQQDFFMFVYGDTEINYIWPLTPSPHILHEKTSRALACSPDTTPA